MTTDQRAISMVQTTDAEFRAWIAAWIASATAAGLTQTSDTGQIDTSTVTRSGSTNTATGYAVFRFNDSLHATKPIYIKMEFGTGSAVTTPSMWLTVATGTDGAGTVTGTTLVPRIQQSIAAAASAIVYSCVVATLGHIIVHVRSPAGVMSLMLFRPCDQDENILGIGLVKHWGSITTDMEVTSYDTTVQGLNVNGHAFPHATTQVYRLDGQPAAFPFIGWLLNTFFVVPGLLGITETSFAPEIELVASPNGVEHTYQAQTHSINNRTTDPSSVSFGRLAMLWE